MIGEAISPAVRVAVRDSGGSTVTDAADAVTIAFAANPAGGLLVGTTTVNAVAGVASFADLAIDHEGIGYTLAATSNGLSSATSATFDVWSSLARIDDVDLGSDTLSIDGFNVIYEATVSSRSSNSMSAILLQAYVDQQSASRAAGGTAVRCSAVVGDLPPGTCSFKFSLGASNTGAGTGTLVPGDATTRFELKDGNSGSVLSTFNTPVTLVEFVEPPLPKARIDSVNLSSTTLAIGTEWVPYTATVTNEEASTVSSVVLQAYIDQGSALRAAGGANVRCGAISGDLPPGTCSFDFTIVASNQMAGGGTLVTGGATARFELKDMYGRVIDTTTVAVTLVN
jgi:hypothetical protein